MAKKTTKDGLIIADGDDAVPIYERIIQDGIRPHAATIGRAHANGEVAVVFFDITPDDGKDHAPMTQAVVRGFRNACTGMGWRGGHSECAAWNRTRSEQFADALVKTAPQDPCAKWLRGRRPGRIFVWSGLGSLCFDVDESGYSLVEGTGDSEWRS